MPVSQQQADDVINHQQLDKQQNVIINNKQQQEQQNINGNKSINIASPEELSAGTSTILLTGQDGQIIQVRVG